MNRTPTRLALFFGLAVCLISLGTGTKSEAQTLLRWSGKPGEKLKYTFNQTMAVKYVTSSQPNSSKNEQTIDFAWTIKSIDKDGVLEVTQVAERAKLRITVAGRILEYDSNDRDAASPELAPMRKVFNAMINQPYILKISPEGEVLDVKVPDAVVGAVGDTPFSAAADSGSFHSPKGVKTVYAQILPVLPKAPVTTSTTWKSELAIPPTGMLVMKQKFDYRIDVITPSFVKIRDTITTSVTPKDESQIQVKVTKQSGETIFIFDTVGGHLTETIQDQVLDMTMNPSGSEVSQFNVITTSFKLAK